MQTNSRRSTTARSSLVVTGILLILSDVLIWHYTQSLSGLLVNAVGMLVFEIFFLNFRGPSYLLRVGRLPFLFWLYLIVPGILSFTYIYPTVLERNPSDVSTGLGMLSAVLIATIRWFQWHYHHVPEILRRHNLSLLRTRAVL